MKPTLLLTCLIGLAVSGGGLAQPVITGQPVDRSVSLGALHTALKRMVEKGYLPSSSFSQLKAKLHVLQMILSTGAGESTEKGRLDDDDSATRDTETRAKSAGF